MRTRRKKQFASLILREKGQHTLHSPGVDHGMRITVSVISVGADF